MIIEVDKFQEVCKKILDAVDSSGVLVVSDTLELELKNKKLYLNVTNKEYYVTVTLNIDYSEPFHAVVNAALFLNLISKLTTKELEMKVEDNFLIIKSNGNYKIPLIYENDKLLQLPKITINEVTNKFIISNTILQSILKYNTKELQKSGVRKLVQKMFYIDDKGAITFGSGACVNSFQLESPITMLLTEKVVKLFKLFLSDSIEFTLGVDITENNVLQTKVNFKDDNVELTSIISSDNSLINSVPIDGIRGLAAVSLPYSIVLDKREVLDAISRLSLFDKASVPILYTQFIFKENNLYLYDTRKINYEKISIINDFNIDEEYILILNTNDLKLTLEINNDQYFTMNFGNNRAVIFEKPGVKNILPECKINN